MKKLIAILILSLPITCFSQVYVGGGLGGSNLNYDLQGWLRGAEQDYLNSQGVGFLNVPFDYNQQFSSRAQKVFVGYEVNKWFSVEFAYKNYGRYSAKAHVDTHINQATGPITSGTPPVTYNANINASAYGDATATGSASSLGLSMLLTPIHGDTANVFFRLGAEYAKIRYSASGNFSYQYAGSAANGPVTTSVNGSGSTELFSEDKMSGFVPVIGLGFDWKLAKHFSLRTEVERAGDPRGSGQSIDMYTASLLYRF